jgi:hypothetical protein
MLTDSIAGNTTAAPLQERWWWPCPLPCAYEAMASLLFPPLYLHLLRQQYYHGGAAARAMRARRRHDGARALHSWPQSTWALLVV